MPVADSSVSPLLLERISCPLCGAGQSREVIQTRDIFCGIPGIYTAVECSRCGHVYMNPRPIPSQIAACYPENYAPHTVPGSAPAAASHHRPWYARPPFRWIPGLKRLYRFLMTDWSQVIPEVSCESPHGLEVGCGRGSFLEKLQRAGWDARGIEPAAQAVAAAQAQGLAVQQGTMEDLDLPEESVDAVFAWMVLEHLIDPRRALETMHGLLKPDGVVCLSVPNFGSWERHLFKQNWFAYDAPRHLHHFRPRVLRHLLTEAGFHDIRIIHQHNIRYLYGSTAAWLKSRNSQSRLADRLMDWMSVAPPLPVALLFAPVGILLAWCRQGGRLTVIARRSPGARVPVRPV